jgi:hypothetical protein
MAKALEKLSFEAIEQSNSKYEEVTERYVTLEVNGEDKEFIVEMYKHFSPLGVEAMVRDFHEKLDTVRRKNKKSWENMFSPYLLFLLIKHFTNLHLPDEFAQQLKAIENMTNTGALFQIFSFMDEDEINKVKDELLFTLDALNNGMADVDIESMKKQYKKLLADKSFLD